MAASGMRLVVVGAAGRMGRTLVRAVLEAEGTMLHAAVEREGAPGLGQDAGVLAGLPASGVLVSADLEAALSGADGIIDFTAPAASVAFAKAAAKHGLVHICGTTGMGDAEFRAIDEAGKRATIVRSGNFSLGVNMLAELVRKAAAALDPSWDIEIVEMHHRMKVDAPSGTALIFGEAAASGRQVALAERAVRSRDGHTGARKAGDIGFAALRGGTVIGDHTTIFAGNGERLELRHIAEDRALFANGAIKAALWAHGRAPGVYSMRDVLGLEG